MNREGAHSSARLTTAALTAAALVVVAGLSAAAPVAGAGQAPLRAARAPAAELELERAITLPRGATVRRYSQVVGGIPVLEAEAVTLDPASTPASLVADATRAAIEPPLDPELTRDQAIAIALEGAAVRRLRGAPRATLAIEPGGGGTLAWRVIAPSARPLADFEVLVDARSGDVLATRDLLWHSTGEARLFLPNPVVSQGSWAHLRRDHRDHNTKRLTSLREHVTLHRMKSQHGCLRGRYANAFLGRDAEAVCKDSMNWNGAKRANNRFEALMTYYWFDRTQEYIQSLGFSDEDGNGANDRRQVGVANAFAVDNSFYSPGNRRIEFGEGGVDDAEDADVIVHEYGHAVQDDQVPNFGASQQAGAMGEGFGDYLAATVTAEMAGAGDFFATCIFDWDGISYIAFEPFCGRTADTEATKTDGQGPPCFGEIHCWGEVWSSALWDLRDTLGDDPGGPPVIDRILIASHFMLTANATFQEAADALIGADNVLYPAGNPHDGQGAHFDAIEDEMIDREFCPPVILGGC